MPRSKQAAMPLINYSRKGDGEIIVLIHGFCENRKMWNHFQSILSEKYTVYSIDLPGFGESESLDSSFSLLDVAQRLINWADEESIEKACWIGHSLGGYVALEVLHIAPQLVSGLGLFHSSAYADSDENKVKRDKAMDFLERHPIEKFIGPFIPSLFDTSRVKELQSEIKAAIEIGLQTQKDTAIGYTLAMRERTNHIDTWSGAHIPLLFIGGTADSRIPIEIAESHVEAGHHVDGYVLKDVGHMGMYEDPNHCLQIINDYLLKVF